MSVLERGDIQFWYRPTVQPLDAPEYELGVQSFFAVLSPAGGQLHRRLRIGRKRMPQSGRDRFWAQIERVGSLQRVLGDLTEPEVYTTKTRGERYQPAARPVASGTYTFEQRDDHVRFAYQLDHVEEHDMIEDGSHLVLFEGGQTWTTTGTPARLDEEGAEIVLVGAKPASEPDAPSREHAAQREDQ